MTTNLTREDFNQANRAFVLMTLDERELVLTEFARLQFPSIIDRFFEAVHSVIVNRQPLGTRDDG